MKTIAELKASDTIIFECISGSKAYGLNTPESDTDIRGVFVLPEEAFYGLEYVGQISNETNDVVYYEWRKFVELCVKNNPNILELLKVPEHCVLYRHPLFERVKLHYFLSKQCEHSFVNYAYTQIRKAQGLEKKIVNPMEAQRKTILEFCKVYDGQKTLALQDFLSVNNWAQSHCGAVKLTGMKDCYKLYYDKSMAFKGLMRSEKSNELALSSVPKTAVPVAILYFNKDGYSSYCKKYKAYWDWVLARNEVRYKSTQSHGKKYDAKNMMHTFRLLHMAEEIASTANVHVHREDRTFLLQVKSGVFEYDTLLDWAHKKKEALRMAFERSKLPERPNMSEVASLLVSLRQDFYDLKRRASNCLY